MDTRSGRFPLVDSLRAAAALAILLYHLAGYAGAYKVTVLGDLARQLQAGVALFFLISGFLLYRPFVAARLAGEPMPFVGAYAWRRFLRIVPAYWIVLTVLGLLLKPQVFDQPLLFYGFAQVYDPAHALGGLALAWSLCVEIAFYATLPLYALAMRALPARDKTGKVRWELAGLVLLAVAGLGFRIWAANGGTSGFGSAELTLPAFLDWFALGLGLAVASAWFGERADDRSAIRWLDRRPGSSWLLAAAAFGLAALAFAQFQDGGARQNVAVHVAYAAMALCLLAPAVLGDRKRGAVRRLMATPTLAWIGLVSYGLFLWQGPVIALLGKWTPMPTPSLVDTSLLWLVVVPPVVVAVAAASYYVVERPALSLKRLVSAPGLGVDQPGAVSAPPLPESR